MTGLLYWRGTNRNGGGVGGCTDRLTPAALAESLYRRRFRTLTVTRDGIEVAGISRNTDNIRTWWGAES